MYRAPAAALARSTLAQKGHVVTEEQPTVEYRDIPGFPGYRVGDDGSVWSCQFGRHHNARWRKLKPFIHQKRTASRTYLCLHLFRNGKRHTRLLHRLVLEAFVGPRPDGDESRHLDGNPLNNTLANLRWGTHAENTADSRRLGRFATKLSEDEVREIRRRVTAGESRKVLAVEFGTSVTNINSIMNGYSWKHLD